MKKFMPILMMLLSTSFAFSQNAKSEKKFSNSIELSDTQENVWNVITDFDTFKYWDEKIIDVRCPEELKKNQSCQAIMSDGQLFDVEIVDIVENESYTLRYKLSSGNIYIKRGLVPGEPLQYTETVWYKGISKKTFEKYKGADYAQLLSNRITNFKKYLESRNQGTGK
ncbi:hypothetical protein [Croceivirga thetidis]|uniref:SRPBCC family protein n=1 Tax=Croceivirga thetidis TaxID=2721623 RepID=A0ABX1GRB4_9FLAO|nr:hypothetical protein [Croceivirga thetidis]NKI32461.1 hypothetical protein [Croceivirga thetidis]